MKLSIWLSSVLIVFVIVFGILYLIFGSPQCDVLANTTAVQLKLIIDEVASDNVPMYPMEGVPDNSFYYRTANIQLCQLGYDVYNYFLVNFMGGFPQYQIYYGHFPEGNFKGGAGMWTEAYPWSGGAASSFAFWGVMRGISVAGKALSWAFEKLSTTYWLWKAAKMVKSVGGNVKEVREAGFLALLRKPNTFQQFLAKDIQKFLKDRNALVIGEILANKDAGEILESLAKAGFLAKDGDNFLVVGGKLVLNDQPMPLVVFEKTYNTVDDSWELVEKGVAIAKNPDGTLDWSRMIPVDNPHTAGDIITQAGVDYDVQKVVPKDIIPELTKEIGKTDKAKALELTTYYTDDVIGAVSMTVENAVKQSSLTKKIYDKTIGRVKRFFKSIELNFLTDTTVFDVEETQYAAVGTIRAFDDRTVLPSGKVAGEVIEKKIVNPVLTDLSTGIKDRIRVALHLADWEEIRMDKIKKFISNIYDELGGASILPKESRYNIWRVAYQGVMDNLEADWTRPLADFQDDILNKIKSLPNFADNFPEFSDIRLNTLIQDLHSSYTDNVMNFGTFVKSDYAAEVTRYYWVDVARSLDIGETSANKEIGIMIGFFKQDATTWPITKKGMLEKYGVRQMRKMLFIDGTAFVTPTSWITKGIAADLMTETCTENSICVYTHGAQLESPFHLRITG